MVTLRNIIKVESILCKNLSSLKQTAQFAVKFLSTYEFTEINIKKPASCEITDVIENKVRVFTNKLIFKTCEDLPQDYENFAFRLTTAEGNEYLLGNAGRPYPIITTSEPLPEKESETSLKTVTVTWKGLQKLNLIVE